MLSAFLFLSSKRNIFTKALVLGSAFCVYFKDKVLSNRLFITNSLSVVYCEIESFVNRKSQIVNSINWYLAFFFVILLENHSETQQIKWFQTHQTLIRQKVFLQLT